VIDPRSRIPAIDRLLADADVQELVDVHGRARVVTVLRDVSAAVRSEVANDPDAWSTRVEELPVYVARTRAALMAGDVPSLRRVVNATGVVLHTNLGRAPLAPAAVEAMQEAAGEYTNLEFDLAEGVRGSRYVHCVSLLTELTGAADALVVNNAAGALVLALNTIARGQRVAISRGELVEIGGGFRIPEVIERAGARLAEVGSTNRTRLADYAAVMDDVERLEARSSDTTPVVATSEPPVAAVLKVHRSNFRITGFTEEAEIDALAALTGEHGLPLVHDLGSGLMVDAADVGLPDEPTARESLAAGADIVVVSGDKLLGGPQAGILVGDRALLARMRKNPLCRALRVDKVTLAGLEATLRLYRDPARVFAEIPILRMLSMDSESLRARAERIAHRLADVDAEIQVVETAGAVGGGTFPGVELASWAVQISGARVNGLAARLRDGDPVVVGRVVDDTMRLDVRTVLPGQEDALVRRVAESA